MTLDPLAVDIYAGDFSGNPNIAALITAGPPWHVISLKATEGTYYPHDTKGRQWFLTHWLPCRIYALERYGVSFFRGAYHYFRVDQDPIKQVDNFLYLVQEAGGWGPGDLPPMLDVESTSNPAHAPAQQVIDTVSAGAGKLYSELGRKPILYAGSYIRDRGITDHMGCGELWCAEYGAHLDPGIYKKMGWTFPLAWQFDSTEAPTGPAGYPTTSPLGPGPCDISAMVVNGGGDDALEYIRTNLLAKP